MPRSGSLKSWLAAQAVKPAERADIPSRTSENLTGILAYLENSQVRKPEDQKRSVSLNATWGLYWLGVAMVMVGTVPLDAVQPGHPWR